MDNKNRMSYMTKTRKSISEITAAILMSLIVVSIGTIVILNYMNASGAQRDIIESQLDKQRYLAEEALFDLMYTIYNSTSNELVIILSSGPGYLEISSIYVNNTLVYDSNSATTAIVNGSSVTGPIVIPEKSVVEIKIPVAIVGVPGNSIIVKVVTEAGTTRIISGVII